MTTSFKTFTKHRSPEHIANGVRFLTRMQDSGYVPLLMAYGDDWLTLEHIDTEPVTDPDALLVECCGLLAALRDRSIIHGDLTDRNILVRGNRPYAIDFAESRYAYETDRTDKREGGDALWLWRAYEGLTGDPRRHARRWLAIRERLAMAGNVLTVLDLGCNRGDMVLMAQADGYDADGVDAEPQEFIAPNIAVCNLLSCAFKADALLLLSVFPYLVRQAGFQEASEWLWAQGWKRLYLECQSRGDGPGPEQFANQADVGAFLSRYGDVTPLVTIPLPDRNAERTTWEVVRR